MLMGILFMMIASYWDFSIVVYLERVLRVWLVRIEYIAVELIVHFSGLVFIKIFFYFIGLGVEEKLLLL